MGYGQNLHSKDLTPIFTDNTDLKTIDGKAPVGVPGLFLISLNSIAGWVELIGNANLLIGAGILCLGA
jgi:hypothetical protein